MVEERCRDAKQVHGTTREAGGQDAGPPEAQPRPLPSHSALVRRVWQHERQAPVPATVETGMHFNKAGEGRGANQVGQAASRGPRLHNVDIGGKLGELTGGSRAGPGVCPRLQGGRSGGTKTAQWVKSSLRMRACDEQSLH